ncbi:MAG: GNAT family N-acetyltransferase [Saprospiraceae bacterium]|nr:GNAT family N-acetyltransferase [Saprospiraceae bacterium]
MITITPVRHEADLHGILSLQQANMRHVLSEEEKNEQGFLSLEHTFADLDHMNCIEKHIVALDGETVVGYVLAMTAASRNLFPLLVPMFDLFDTLHYRGRPISGYSHMVIGQVCVSKNHRGRNIFDNLYATYREQFAGKYDLAVTEIAAANERSRRAHKRVGYEEIATYTAPDGVEWVVVVWDWQHIILETPRLYLREMTPADAENAYLLNLDPEVVQYTGDEPFESVEEARKFLEKYDHYRKYGFGRWAVILKETGEYLGWCGLKYIAEDDEFDIGFRFFKKHWNKGYATEAAKPCLELGFKKFNMPFIVGRAMKANVGSIRVLEKCGLTYWKAFDFDGEEGVVYRIDP